MCLCIHVGLCRYLGAVGRIATPMACEWRVHAHVERHREGWCLSTDELFGPINAAGKRILWGGGTYVCFSCFDLFAECCLKSNLLSALRLCVMWLLCWLQYLGERGVIAKLEVMLNLTSDDPMAALLLPGWMQPYFVSTWHITCTLTHVDIKDTCSASSTTL